MKPLEQSAIGADPDARVLVVDDEARSLRLVARVLGSASIPSATAGCASEALVKLRAMPTIDVVLSDIYMPATDGLEFLSQVRQEFPDRPWLQLLLITGQASLETALAAMRLDASDYLLKPVDPKALRESVQHALDRAESIRQVRESLREFPQGAELHQLADAARAFVAEIGRAEESRQPQGSSLTALQLLQRLQQARATIFGQAVMPEPAWEMLAELMRARLARQQVSITSLALASSSPTTTALRRIDDLIQGGLVVRVPDPADRRRTHLELTPEGVMRMQRFLEGFSSIVLGPR